MTVNFTDAFKNQLKTWIGGNKEMQFVLLYKATRDCCTPVSFHNQCNNKGPTVTVLYNTNNTVYGGYTSVSWHSNGAYTNDANAFLFRLNYNGAFQPIKFPAKAATNAIYGHSSYGPTFGGGHDLNTFLNTINISGNQFALNGTFSPGTTYDMHGCDINAFTNGHKNVLDIEVYAVEEKKAVTTTTMLGKEWRRNIVWSAQVMDELEKEIITYAPPESLNIPQTKVLLIGQVGVGKSSFFNTINSIFRGHITGQANCGSAEQSLTTVYRMYQIWSNQTRKPLNFRLCDTQGLEEDKGLDVNDIGYILDGHVPDKYQFNPSTPLSSDIAGWVQSPKLKDKIHCVVFVVDGSTIDVMPAKVLQRIKRLQSRMNQKGVPQIVLMTKIDKVCEFVSDDVSAVFKSSSVRDCIDKVSTSMGLPRQNILPFKNYECEIDLDNNINILSLIGLRQILRFADDYLHNFLDDIPDIKQTKLRHDDVPNKDKERTARTAAAFFNSLMSRIRVFTRGNPD